MVGAIEQPAGDDQRATVNGASEPPFAIDVWREKSLHAFGIPEIRSQANDGKKFVGNRAMAA